MIRIPPQSHPAHDQLPDGSVSRLFKKEWYLQLSDIAIAVNKSTLLRAAQSDLASLRLGPNDYNVLVEVTDFRHILRWDGARFRWGPGEDGRHDIVGMPIDPDDLTGWQLCDGTTVTYLNGDGTTGSFATPDLIGGGAAAYLKLGDTVSGPNAATAPVFTGTSATPSGTISGIASSGSGSVNVLASSITQVSPAAHTHPAPTFTGNAATPSGTVSATGEPRNYVARPFFRR